MASGPQTLAATAVARTLQGSQTDWEQIYLAHARGDRRDLIPFPDENIQRLTNNAAGEDTARDGIQILRQLLLMAKEVRPFARTSRVLDYGCGWGRLTRLLPYCIDIDNIVGVDVDERLISSANELLPFLDHQLIGSMTPLPFDDHSFDLVFANSVFSHLSLSSHQYAMGEIARVLTAEGVVVASVLDTESTHRFYSNPRQRSWITGVLGDADALASTLASSGFAWGSTQRWEDYGLAVVTEDWLQHNWGQLGLKPMLSQRGEHARAQLFYAAQRTDPI